MSNNISMGINLANLSSGVDINTITQFFAENIDTYTLAPKKPGTIRGAGYDIVLILTITGSVASLASLLWQAYDKFIARKKANDSSDAGIYISIRRSDGSTVDFCIGNQYKDCNIFIQEFTSKVNTIREKDDARFWLERLAEIESSGRWIKVKKNLKKH